VVWPGLTEKTLMRRSASITDGWPEAGRASPPNRETPTMQKSEGLSLIPESGQAAESRLYTFTVGICATGQPRTLQPLLATVLASEMPGFVLKRVVLVASACSEATLREARRMAAQDRRVTIFEHERRTGKADAVNEVIRETEGDFLVYVNADAMISPESIPSLLKGIERDEGTGFMSGRPIFGKPRGLVSYVLDVMWTSYNLLSSDPKQSQQSNHGTDELMVIRSELLPELPPGLVNDGAYIAGTIRERGYRVGVEADAVVQVDVPNRMVDVIRQRRRILFGHIQVKRLVGKVPRTVETMMFFSPRASAKIVVRMLAKRPKLALVLPIAATGELIALSGALWDTVNSSKSHAVWKRYRDR